MKKLTKKLLITTSTILGLLTIGVGTSIALSSCAKKELKLENLTIKNYLILNHLMK